jgi:hypothetical protein
MTAIAAMMGIDRQYLYEIIMGAPVSADYCKRLTPLSRGESGNGDPRCGRTR